MNARIPLIVALVAFAGADALLFVEPDRSLLHLRLVETQYGERSRGVACLLPQER